MYFQHVRFWSPSKKRDADKFCTIHWMRITSVLSDTLQIPILIFCSIDMDNLACELLVQPCEPFSWRGFSCLVLLDMAVYLQRLLSGAAAFKRIAWNQKKESQTIGSLWKGNILEIGMFHDLIWHLGQFKVIDWIEECDQIKDLVHTGDGAE